MIYALRDFVKEIVEWKVKFLVYDVFKNGFLYIFRLVENVFKVEEWKFEYEKEGKKGMWLCFLDVLKLRMFLEMFRILRMFFL